MTPELEQKISSAEKLAYEGKTEEAFLIASELVVQHPNETKVWTLRAFLYGNAGNYEAAISDMSSAISISQAEPSYCFNRGRYRLMVGDLGTAIEDFTEGLALCDRYNNDYYRETLLFMRAEALVAIGQKQHALDDLAHVREDFTIWTTRLRTKADIVAECLG